MNRRVFTGGLATLGAATLAGCTDLFLTTVEGQPDPHVPPELLSSNGFVEIDKDVMSETETVELSGVSQDIEIDGTTYVYEDEPLRHRIREETLSELDASIRTFFTTKLAINPNPSNIPGIGESALLNTVAPNIEESFVTQLESQGVRDITQTSETTLAIDTGEEARLYEYSGQYEYSSIEFPISNDASVVIPAGEVAIDAMYALWVRDGFVLVAGGGYPVEDVVETVENDVTDALSVRVDINLQLSGTEHRDDLEELMAAVS